MEEISKFYWIYRGSVSRYKFEGDKQTLSARMQWTIFPQIMLNPLMT